MSGHAKRSRQRGIATVEFALVAPLIMLLLAGVLDFSLLLRTATTATDAARAGAEYGSRGVLASVDLSGMEAAARNAAPGLTGMTASAARSCMCKDGSAVGCTGTCPSGALQVYVKVTTQVATHTVFDYSGVSIPGTVSASASMRAQ